MAQKKSYSRYFIILQEDEKGYALASDKLPSGYAKLEVKNDKCKISYYVQNLKKESAPYYMILICNKKDVKKIIKIGELNIDEHGRAEVFYEYPEGNIAETSIAVDRITGAAVIKLMNTNIIPVLSGFATTEIPDWKGYEVVGREMSRTVPEDVTPQDEEKTVVKEELDRKEEVKEKTNEFDEYEKKIEEVKESVEENKIEIEVVEGKIRDNTGNTENIESVENVKNMTDTHNAENLDVLEVKVDEKDVRDKEVSENEVHDKEVNNKEEDLLQEDNSRHKKHEKEHEKKYENHEEEFKQKFIEEDEAEKVEIDFIKETDIDIKEIKIEEHKCDLEEDCEHEERKHHKEHYEEKKHECKEYPKSNLGNFFKGLVEDFEELEDICCEIKRCRWYKISVTHLEYMANVYDYNKYTIVYYPMTSYYQYIKRHGHYILGHKFDKDGNVKYLVYGIPGTKSRYDQPFGGRSGFVTWVPLKEGDEAENSMGYWLMFYDFRNSTVVIPVR